jgi:CheY-like chemotaxis protein
MSNNKLILIVDDDEISLEMIASVLLAEGYHVSKASGAKMAMEFVEQNKNLISAILMDLVMPRYSGIVAIKTIK